MEERTELGARLKQLRAGRHLSQLDVATRTGIPLSTIAMYELGKRVPRYEQLKTLCEFYHTTTDYIMYGKAGETKPSAKSIPVLGNVAAGIPIEEIVDVTGHVEIEPERTERGTYFGLEVRGDSMSPMIESGDILIVRQQTDAETDDIVIAQVDRSNATCKKLKKYRDGIALVSLNPHYEPMYFSTVTASEVQIIGKVEEIRRRI